jgi:hypothetical protein
MHAARAWFGMRGTNAFIGQTSTAFWFIATHRTIDPFEPGSSLNPSLAFF